MTPIQLDFKPSALLIAILASFTALTCFMVMLVDVVWQWRLILLLGLGLSAAYAIGMHGLLLWPWSVVMLTVNAKNELQLYRKDGVRMLAQLQASSVATPYLTILQVHALQDGAEKARRRHQAVIVLPDKVEKEAYRQLRVWMRWGNHNKSSQPVLP